MPYQPPAPLFRTSLRRFALVCAFAGASVLAACGGGGSSPDRTASSIEVGKPGGILPYDDPAPYIALAQQASCADKMRKVVRIDGNVFLVALQGSCADAAYSYTLYSGAPGTTVCKSAQTIAGDRTSCSDPAYTSLFNTIIANIALPGLGIDKGHKVEVILDNRGFDTIAFGASSGVHETRSVVVRDQRAWDTLWAEHTSNIQTLQANPAPKVDFSKKMVIAVFRGWDRPQEGAPLITNVMATNDGLQVEYAFNNKPPAEVEIAMVTSPYHFVSVDINEGNVRFAAQGPRVTLPLLSTKLAESEHSAITTARTEVVRDATAWAALWKEHAGPITTPLPAPEVDFSKNMVIALFTGDRAHPGYTLALNQLYTAGDTMWVEYDDAGPLPAVARVSIYPAVIVDRALFLVLPKNDFKVNFFRHVQ